jgi:hypothetical protein
MNASPPAAAGPAEHARIWVTSMGGPLVVVPVTALTGWGGGTQTGMIVGGTDTPDDYDRACAVDGLARAVAVGEEGAQALVLADEPANTCYLPERQVFLRWLAADSEAGLLAAADRVLADPSIVWDDCGIWKADGPAVLMDSVNAGADLGVEYPGGGLPDQAPVPLPGGSWTVRAVHTEVDGYTWVGLVHLLPAGP